MKVPSTSCASAAAAAAAAASSSGDAASLVGPMPYTGTETVVVEHPG